MRSTKRSFSLPSEVSTDLDETVPSQERSSFVAKAVRKELEAVKRQKFLEYLDAMEFQPPQEDDTPSSVEIIRELREGRTNQLANNLSS